jgi:hypothetical protein
MHGRIFQVTDRANGKQAMVGKDKDSNTDYATQALQVIEHVISERGYTRPAVITFKNLADRLSIDGASVGHFYAARGTNAHEGADAVFIAGAPQASPYQVVETAKMVFWEDDAAFDTAWVSKDVPYQYADADGVGRCYPVSGFWRDVRLQAVLESIREDEIIQAAHRGRPVNHPVDIWLLTNVPIDGLPPDELLTMRDVLGVAAGVNIWKYRALLDKAAGASSVSVADAQSVGISYATARSYIKRLAEQPGWTLVSDSDGGRGRPVLRAVRSTLSDIL